MSKKRHHHIGSSLDDFLKEDGTLEELQVQAIKRGRHLAAVDESTRKADDPCPRALQQRIESAWHEATAVARTPPTR